MVLFIPFMLITAYFWTRWVIFPASLHRHATVVVFGLAAFFIHAHVNNFLDDCKVAFLFWTGLAYLTPAAPARRT